MNLKIPEIPNISFERARALIFSYYPLALHLVHIANQTHLGCSLFYSKSFVSVRHRSSRQIWCDRAIRSIVRLTGLLTLLLLQYRRQTVSWCNKALKFM